MFDQKYSFVILAHFLSPLFTHDHSSPIINGALGVKFSHDGSYIKPKEKLESIMETDLTDKIDIIKHNVELFRKSISWVWVGRLKILYLM